MEKENLSTNLHDVFNEHKNLVIICVLESLLFSSKSKKNEIFDILENFDQEFYKIIDNFCDCIDCQREHPFCEKKGKKRDTLIKENVEELKKVIFK